MLVLGQKIITVLWKPCYIYMKAHNKEKRIIVQTSILWVMVILGITYFCVYMYVPIARCKSHNLALLMRHFQKQVSKPACRLQRENVRLKAVLWILIILDTIIDSVRETQSFHRHNCMWKMLSIGEILAL